MQEKYRKPQISTVGLVARYKLWAGSVNGLTDIFDYSLNGLMGEWIGPNLVTNGTFTGNADNWNLDAGWIYGSNALTVTADGTILFLTQTGTSLVLGTMYRIKYTISNSDMDGSGLGFSSVSAFGSQNLDHTNGTHIYYLPKTTESPPQDILFFIAANSTSGRVLTIDNIEVSEVASPPSDGRGIIFDGLNSRIDVGTGPSSVKSVAIWIKQVDITGNEFPIDLNGTDFISVVSGVVTVNGFTAAKLYVDGVLGTSGVTSIAAATWAFIVVTDTTASNATVFDIGKETANFFEGTIGEVMLFDKVLSPAEVKSIYELTKWRYGQ